MLLSCRRLKHDVQLDFIERIVVAFAGVVRPFGRAILNPKFFRLLGGSGKNQKTARCALAERPSSESHNSLLGVRPSELYRSKRTEVNLCGRYDLMV